MRARWGERRERRRPAHGWGLSRWGGSNDPLAACFKGVRALCRQSLTAKIAIADRR